MKPNHHFPSRYFTALLVCVAMAVLSACATLFPPHIPRVLLVVPQSQIADVEYEKPRAALDAMGAQVSVATVTLDEASGKTLRIKPDLTIDNAKAEDYDAIAVIGGWGTMYQLWDHAGLHALLRDADQQDRIVAAICAGPIALAHAGLLKGRNATSSPDVKKGDQTQRKEMVSHGALYRDDMLVVVDGHFITANGPQSSSEFGDTLVKQLQARIN
ncbi:MAG TPA: DJ-1/PfpI family protein [Rhodocyclaceae bacterium]|nr:DJ-1/PfpI family protein [Rhodocyclaceae bacterium]